MQHDVLEPHPEISRFYTNPRAKQAFLKDIFDDTASDYDRIENVLALGSGRWYRRKALERAVLQPGQTALDVAMGTGLVAREAIKLVAPRGRVMGLDPSRGMVDAARASLDLPVVLGRAEQLPFADASFDFLSMGYALRHMTDLRVAFSEFYRVLRPGGRVCLLEIVRPRGRVQRKLLEAYFRGVLPVLSRVFSRQAKSGSLWDYYWETIDLCVPAETVLNAMIDAGFEQAQRHVVLGVFAEYTGTTPADPSRRSS